MVLRTIGLGICEQRRTRVLLLRFLKGPGRAYDEDAAIAAEATAKAATEAEKKVRASIRCWRARGRAN